MSKHHKHRCFYCRSRSKSGGAKVQVTGHRTGHKSQDRSQVTGHRSQDRSQVTGHRSQVTGQVTGHRSQVTMKNTGKFAASSYLVGICLFRPFLTTHKQHINNTVFVHILKTRVHDLIAW